MAHKLYIQMHIAGYELSTVNSLTSGNFELIAYVEEKERSQKETQKSATRMSSTQAQYIRNVRLANRYGHNFHYIRKFKIAFRQSLRRKTDRAILHTQRERQQAESAVHTIKCMCASENVCVECFTPSSQPQLNCALYFNAKA